MSDQPDQELPEVEPPVEPPVDPPVEPPVDPPVEPPPAREAMVQVVARYALRLNTLTDTAVVQGGGVPTAIRKSLWDEWLETHRDSQMIRSGAIRPYE